MKQLLLISSLLLLSFTIYAQMSFSPDTLEESAIAVPSLDIKTLIYLTNDLATDQITNWSIDRTTPTEHDHLPQDEWDFFVCDKNTCYVPAITDSPLVNPFSPNETFAYEFHMRPNQVPGIGDVILHITAEDGTILTSIPIHYDIIGTVSTDEVELNEIKVYPNPTTDIIQIENDSNVSRVVIYNIVGKQVNSSSHEPSKAHDVTALQNGIYLVKLFDSKENVLSVLKLNKN